METQQPADSTNGDPNGLSPDDISSFEFPISMRGFDRDAVKRWLRRFAESYAAVLRQRDRLRAAAEEATERAAAAESEVQASTREIANLTKRCALLESDLENARADIAALEQVSAEESARPVDAAAGTDKMALERALARIAELESEAVRLQDERRRDEAASAAAVPAEPTQQAGELLVAALQAGETLRSTAREEAQRTLKKARERSAEISRAAELRARELGEARAETERLRIAAELASAELDRARAARAEVERETELVRARVRAEVEQTITSLTQQRERVQTLLGDALAALDADDGGARGLLDDLAARLTPQTVDDGGSDLVPEPTEPA